VPYVRNCLISTSTDGRNNQDGQPATAKFRSDFSTFNDVGRRHLGFVKFQFFNGRSRQDGRTASPCRISWRSVKSFLRCGDFSIFQDGGRRQLEILIFEILTVGTVKRAKLRQHAKFRGDRSNRRRDMAIFRFFQDGGRPPSWICDAYV